MAKWPIMRKLFFLLGAIFLSASEPTLYIDEIGRINLADGYPSVYYRLRAENFEPGAVLKLFSERIGARKHLLETYTVNEAGKLIGADGTELLDNVQMAAYYCMGEPFRFFLEDHESEISAVTIPHPITAQSEDGASISIEMTDLTGKSFVCRGSGFQPDEKIRLCSVSMGHAIDEVVLADAEGKIWIPLDPAVKKKKSGKCAIELRRQNGSLAVKFDWGRDALRKPTAKIADIPTEQIRKKTLEELLRSSQEKS